MATKLKHILSLLLILSLFSCYNNEQKKVSFDEEKIIPEEKMVDILTDIHILEGVVYIKLRSDRQVIDSISRAYYDVVLDKYNISEEEFELSMEYYTYHIEKMDKIFEDVITKLSLIESEETVKEVEE